MFVSNRNGRAMTAMSTAPILMIALDLLSKCCERADRHARDVADE